MSLYAVLGVGRCCAAQGLLAIELELSLLMMGRSAIGVHWHSAMSNSCTSSPSRRMSVEKRAGALLVIFISIYGRKRVVGYWCTLPRRHEQHLHTLSR